MRKMHKPIIAGIIVAGVALSAITAALASEDGISYAYIPDRSVYFYDVSGSYAWASTEVDALALSGVIQGNGQYLFEPGRQITRADFVVMLDRAYNMSRGLESGVVESAGQFADVADDMYYAKSVAAAKAWGIATGSGDNLFYPQQSMTRQEAMVFITRTIENADMRFGKADISVFSDVSDISSYAADAMMRLVDANVIQGSGDRLFPKATVTRAEIAVMLYRATHLNSESGTAKYAKRDDVVTLCVGEQVYGDVVIKMENAQIDGAITGLFELVDITEKDSTITATLGASKAFTQKAQVADGNITIKMPTEKDPNRTETIPLAQDCIAIDVSPYHRMEKPVNTSKEYPYCVPVIAGGKVTILYYQSAA